MNKGIHRVVALLAILLMLVLSACAGGGAPASQPNAQAPSGSTGGTSGAVPPASAPSDEKGQAGDSQQNGNNQNLPTSNPQAPFDERKIIRTGSLALVVEKPALAAADIQRIAETLKGYVQSSQINDSGSGPIASIVVKVPSESFFDAMNQIKQLAKGDRERVRSESSKADDVTEEYTDIENQLTTLRTQYNTYLDLLKQSKTVDDSLKIRARIDDLQNQINRLEGRRNYLSQNAAFSTINITVSQPAGDTIKIGETEWNPLVTIRNAWNAFLVVARGIIDLLIYVVILGWPFAVLAVLIVWLVRRNSRPRRMERAATPPPPPAPTAQ